MVSAKLVGKLLLMHQSAEQTFQLLPTTGSDGRKRKQRKPAAIPFGQSTEDTPVAGPTGSWDDTEPIEAAPFATHSWVRFNGASL